MSRKVEKGPWLKVLLMASDGEVCWYDNVMSESKSDEFPIPARSDHPLVN